MLRRFSIAFCMFMVYNIILIQNFLLEFIFFFFASDMEEDFGSNVLCLEYSITSPWTWIIVKMEEWR